jgi:hypothetical protein
VEEDEMLRRAMTLAAGELAAVALAAAATALARIKVPELKPGNAEEISSFDISEEGLDLWTLLPVKVPGTLFLQPEKVGTYGIG